MCRRDGTQVAIQNPNCLFFGEIRWWCIEWLTNLVDELPCQLSYFLRLIGVLGSALVEGNKYIRQWKHRSLGNILPTRPRGREHSKRRSDLANGLMVQTFSSLEPGNEIIVSLKLVSQQIDRFGLSHFSHTPIGNTVQSCQEIYD